LHCHAIRALYFSLKNSFYAKTKAFIEFIAPTTWGCLKSREFASKAQNDNQKAGRLGRFSSILRLQNARLLVFVRLFRQPQGKKPQEVVASLLQRQFARLIILLVFENIFNIIFF
jgi:hypothetical protein